MDNVTEALKMAASVLVFVLALSISINAFGQARRTSQIVLEYNDREYDYSWIENNGSTNRIVGMETIIPSLYRAYRENYKVIFKFVDSEYYLYSKKEADGSDVKSYTIDLEKEKFSGDTQKEQFIDIMVFGRKSQYAGEQSTVEKETGMTLNSESLYDIIEKGKCSGKFKEELGIYYQEELEGKYDTPLANRNKKRVITYTEQ